MRDPEEMRSDNGGNFVSGEKELQKCVKEWNQEKIQQELAASAVYMAGVFWRRWLKEYLPILQQRQKWNQPRKNVQVGNIVLVLQENTPHNLWPLARVMEVHLNQSDGYVSLKRHLSLFKCSYDVKCKSKPA